MDIEVEHRGAITTIFRLSIVGVNTGRIECVTIEYNRIAFDDVLGFCIVVRFVDGQDERNDAVATILCNQRVAIYTSFRY